MVAAAGALASPTRLAELLGPVVTDAGLELEHLEVVRAGRRQVLRVVVDRAGGVDLDAVAEISRAVSVALDGSDEVGGAPYVLEVSSPGVDRPLTQPRHWERAVGRLVRIDRTEGGPVTARVVDADADAVRLAGPGAPERLRYAEVRRARVEVEFSRGQETGGTEEGG